MQYGLIPTLGQMVYSFVKHTPKTYTICVEISYYLKDTTVLFFLIIVDCLHLLCMLFKHMHMILFTTVGFICFIRVSTLPLVA